MRVHCPAVSGQRKEAHCWDTGLSLEQRGPRDPQGHRSSLQGRITELGSILQKLSPAVKRSQDIHYPSRCLAWKHHQTGERLLLPC